MRTALSIVIVGAVLLLGSGCSFAAGRITPEHFQFVTVVQLSPRKKAGGWREACVHARIKNVGTGQSMVCSFGIGMPLRTDIGGDISTPLAQRIAADCANEAAHLVLASANRTSMIGVLCQNVRSAYDLMLRKAVGGSARQTCHDKTTPVVFGEP